MISVLGLDLDGTVVDSLEMTLELMQDVIENKAKVLFSKDNIVHYFGLPEERIFELLVPQQAELIHQEYLKGLESRIPQLKCFDGIVDQIRLARLRGMKVGLYTARGRAATQLILDRLELTPLLDWWITGSDLDNPKPHPDGLLRMARAFQVSPERCVYIGDSPKDIKMARTAGFRAFGANWCSMSNEKELLAEQPQQVLTDPRQLSSVLV